ncbi:hypothetical protein GPJ56_002887 [Histomonas meleagridis]|uniref:uncharacterized protein n=1 Tax=Histomonas meleagridis TaxID=135588 RepID=UPI003559840F|nr:hypothetical protein GPJ56_002887 [Histomonas meleagridis]KAH0800412.1 hypothetical protein GO595_006823 [Histomonas meleagridis]
MSTETVSFSTLFDQYLQKSAQTLSEYSTIVCAIAGKEMYLVPPIPIENKKLEQKKAKSKKEKTTGEDKKKDPLSQEEIDDIIIKAASRTSLDLHSKSFLDNLKKKLPGISKKDVEKRVDELSQKGKLKKKEK